MGILEKIKEWKNRRKEEEADPQPSPRTPAPIPFVPPIASSQDDVIEYLSTCPAGITFIHGKAGSGKTHIIKKIEKMNKGCQVLTPTNLAATLYRGARTIFSFFHGAFDSLDEGYQDPANITLARVRRLAGQLAYVKMLVIDEISMVRADTFESMDKACRLARDCELPFGGLCVVVVGDLFQLPPIVSDDAIFEYLRREYGGIYFFDSHVVKSNINSIKLFELEKSYRQDSDPQFVELLDTFRRPLTAADKRRIIRVLNSRVVEEVPDDVIYIASTNEEVSAINAASLNSLPGVEHNIAATYKIKHRDKADHMSLCHTDLPIEANIESIVLPTPYDGILRFKKDARVMLTKNCKVNGERYYNNGDFGVIEDFKDGIFTIRLKNGRRIVCPNKDDRYWDKQMHEYRYLFEYDEKTQKPKRISPYVQRTSQYPLKLAYAFTIHKSQGQTYEKVILDLKGHITAPGQLYVALSRAKSLDGLFLTKRIAFSDIITDDAIILFLNSLRLANGAKAAEETTEIAPPSDMPRPLPAISNPRCDSFIRFVRMNESNPAIKDFICHTLESYKSVFALSDHDMAFDELIKIIDLVNTAYYTDRYDDMIASMHSRQHTADDCKYNLNAIFEIYTDVVGAPRRQFSSDHLFLPQ